MIPPYQHERWDQRTNGHATTLGFVRPHVDHARREEYLAADAVSVDRVEGHPAERHGDVSGSTWLQRALSVADLFVLGSARVAAGVGAADDELASLDVLARSVRLGLPIRAFGHTRPPAGRSDGPLSRVRAAGLPGCARSGSGHRVVGGRSSGVRMGRVRRWGPACPGFRWQ